MICPAMLHFLDMCVCSSATGRTAPLEINNLHRKMARRHAQNREQVVH